MVQQGDGLTGSLQRSGLKALGDKGMNLIAPWRTAYPTAPPCQPILG